MGDWKRVIYLTSIMSTWLGLVMLYLFLGAITKGNFLMALVFAALTVLMLDPFTTFVSDRALDVTEGFLTLIGGGVLAYLTVKYLIASILAALPWKIL